MGFGGGGADTRCHRFSSYPTLQTVYNAHVDVSGIDEAKLVRKIDWRLLPWLSFLYLLSFLDRTSIGNAKVSFTDPFALSQL
jgi:predicted transcriptional regulator